MADGDENSLDIQAYSRGAIDVADANASHPLVVSCDFVEDVIRNEREYWGNLLRELNFEPQ